MRIASLITALAAITFGIWVAAKTGDGLGAFTVGYVAATWTGHQLFRVHHRETHRHALIIAFALLFLLPAVRRRFA